MSAPSFEAVKNEYTHYWGKATIIPARLPSITAAAKRILAGKSRYEVVAKQLGNNIPWFFIGCIHMREANCNFNAHLHNGDPLSARTHHVPAGRPLTGSPPFTWEASALDALKMRRLDKIVINTVERFAYEAEGYNGWGYHGKHLESPYDWSGIDNPDKAGWQELAHGKYVRDHVFDPSVIDQQPGVMSLLKVLMSLDPTVGFPGTVQTPPVAQKAPQKPAENTSPTQPHSQVPENAPPSNLEPGQVDPWGVIGQLLVAIFKALTGSK